MKQCTCDKFEAGLKAINGPIHLQSVRSGGKYQFDKEYVFKFCPWCGCQLHQPDDEHWNAFVKLTDNVELNPL